MRPLQKLVCGTALAFSLTGMVGATPLKVVLPAARDVKGQGTYACKLTVDQVVVTAKPGQNVSAANMQEYQKRIAQGMLDTFEEYVADLSFTLSGRSVSTNGKVTLPAKATFTDTNFTMQLNTMLTPNQEGWLQTEINPLNNLTWRGQGDAPLDVLRKQTRQAVSSFMLNTNLPFGYDNAAPISQDDRLVPGLFCLDDFMKGEIDSTTRITWPTAQQYRVESLAAAGQKVQLLGQPAIVLDARSINQGQYTLNWPGNFKANTLLKLQLDYPTGNLPVNARVTVSFSSATTGNWSKP